jgi:serine/threonine protein kinase
MTQLVEAVYIMHSFGIAHGDFKPDNIIFDKDYNLKLIDFGSSCELNEKQTTVIGTPFRLSHEVNLI